MQETQESSEYVILFKNIHKAIRNDSCSVDRDEKREKKVTVEVLDEMNLECSILGKPHESLALFSNHTISPKPPAFNKVIIHCVCTKLFSVYSVTLQEETQHIIKPAGHKNDCDRHKIKRKQNMTGCSTNR